MVNVIQKPPPTSPQMRAILEEFERLITLGCSTEIIKQQFVKDELLLILMYYREYGFLTPSVKTETIEHKEVENE